MRVLDARMFGHRIFVLFVGLAAIAFAMLPSASHAQVVPSVLEEMRLVTQDDDSDSFIPRFSPREPRVAVVDRNPTSPELVMATALKTGRVANRHTYRGIVRVVQFATQGSSLIMRFDTA